MRRLLISLFLLSLSLHGFSQGYNHNWLLGYLNNTDKARLQFTDTSASFITETRKIQFEGSQSNISDQNGNLLMSTNGIWIADATGDTMANGGGLNPGYYTSQFPKGFAINNANIFLPWPGDNSRFALLHHTATLTGSFYLVRELFISIVDITMNGGLGSVIQKNSIVLQDTLVWGMGAVKHANGRDWWIVMHKESSDLMYKLLFTPSGITSITSQHLNLLPNPFGAATQFVFSPDGEKLAFGSTLNINGIWNHDARVMNFDRCSGLITNQLVVSLMDSAGGLGIAFSPSSQYLYASTVKNMYQINMDTSDIVASVKLVAQNDLFYSPSPPFQTDFFSYYLAANGKIYATSGNSVQHIHVINQPDSSGLSCDVQQHGVSLNGIWNWRTVPNHPNYYLGAVTGSVCDSLGVGIQELQAHDFRMSVSPNPTNGSFRLLYLLPQNQSGVMEVYDVNGRRVYAMNLPPWSTLQEVALPSELAGGVYSCVVRSGGQRASRKLVVIKN